MDRAPCISSNQQTVTASSSVGESFFVTKRQDLKQQQLEAWVLDGQNKYSTLPKIQTANDWAQAHFPRIAEVVPYAFLETLEINGIHKTFLVKQLNDDFWAQVLGPRGIASFPTVFNRNNGQFYRFNEGIYVPITEERVMADLCTLLDQSILYLGESMNLESMAQQKARKRLYPVILRAKELLAAADGFFMESWDRFLPVKNGIYDHNERKLLPFDPKFTFRSKLPVDFKEGANCNKLLYFLRFVLTPEDLSLLQRYLAQLVLGKNPTQKILVLTGAAGYGKGTILNLVRSILGDDQIGVLRENLFTHECELARYAGKKLLVHPDLPTEYLNRPEAALIKELVGADPLWAEVKDQPDPLLMTGNFNMILCCNGKPKIYLDEDIDAWKRRLAVIQFHTPNHGMRAGNLSERLLKDEASGFLNWLLAGLEPLKQDNYQLKLKEEQESRVNDLLLASESTSIFVRHYLKPCPEYNLTIQECYRGYRMFCQIHGIQPVVMSKFTGLIVEPVKDVHGRAYRHDLKDENGRAQRGWRHLKWEESEIVKN